jgi:glycerol 3-phosphatase-2
MTSAPLPAGTRDGSAQPATGGPLSRRYDVALLDLDGVVYRGADAVPGAPAALSQARSAGMRLSFVTNNASRTPDQIAAHLGELGVAVRPDEVVTSAQAAATLLVERIGPGGRVFVVGGVGLRDAVEAVGLVPVERYDAVPPPQAVVQGFSPDLRYEDLAQATFAVAAGAIWVATNTDATLPTARGIQPGNGTLVAAVATATGEQPVVAGKPERALVDEAIHRSGATRPLIVGDRLDTDIEGAVRADLDSLLVLTGISTVADLLTGPPGSRPTFLGADLSALASSPARLAELLSLPPPPTGWRVAVKDDTVRLTRAGDEAPDADPLDPVRLVVAAAWAVVDAGHQLAGVLVPPKRRQALLDAGLPASLLRDAEQDDAEQDNAQQDNAQQDGRSTDQMTLTTDRG